MSLLGFDTIKYVDASHNASQFSKAGYKVAGGYFFDSSEIKQRITRAAAKAFAACGINTIAFWENGSPTNVEYFENANAAAEGEECAAQALDCGIPAGGPAAFYTVDYDAGEADLPAIIKYATAFREPLKLDGYSAGVYANGLVCAKLKELGLVSHTVLAAGNKMQGYTMWHPNADIVQYNPNTQICGFNCDKLSLVGAQSGQWRPIS